MGSKRAGPIDAMVGRTIRALRLSKGISQGALGRRLGVSFQQIQKYENGTNRVGAGRLAQIATALDVPMGSLLQGVQASKRKTRPDDDPLALLSTSQAMRLARAFSKIANGRIRSALVGLAEGIASQGAMKPAGPAGLPVSEVAFLSHAKRAQSRRPTRDRGS